MKILNNRSPNQPQKNDPFKKNEDDNDPTRIRPGINEPEKNDPTKIDTPPVTSPNPPPTIPIPSPEPAEPPGTQNKLLPHMNKF